MNTPYEGAPKKDKVYKKLCFYSYMFKVQSPSKYSLFDAIHIPRLFSTVQTVLNSSILTPFSASAIFFSPLPHQQNVSLRGILSSRETKKKFLGSKIKWLGRLGTGVRPFLVNSCWTPSVVWAGAPWITHHEMGKVLKESSKKVHWSQTEPLTTS